MAQDTLEHNDNDTLDDSLNPANHSEFSRDTDPGSTDMSEPENKSGSSPSELKAQEESSTGFADSATGGDNKERLGLGYTNKDSGKSKGTSKLSGSSSKTKKKIAIFGAAAGGSVIISVIVFLAMLPLKIGGLISQLDAKFTAGTTQALQKETESLFSSYVKNSMLPGLLAKKSCTRTIDPGCAPIAAGTGPIGSLYASWTKDRLDRKLATDYNMVIGKHSDGSFVLNINGNEFNIDKLRTGDQNLFDLIDTNHNASNADLKAAIDKALEGETKWKATYKRFFITKRVDGLLGSNLHCIVACDTRTKTKQTLANKKLAAKLWVTQKVINPLGESYGVFVQCVLAPDSCTRDLSTRSADGRQETAIQKKLNDAITSYLETHTATDLAKLASSAGDLNKLGVGGYLSKLVAQQIADKLGGDGAKVAAGAAVEKAVPIVGWISLAITLRTFMENAPSSLKYLAYASHTTAAAQTYTTYRTVADEIQSGHTDATEVGSFVDSLGSVSDIGSSHSDATSTPLYASLIGNGGSQTAASIFGVDNPAVAGKAYTCDDGSAVPEGKLVCDNEDFANAGLITNALSDFNNYPLVKAYLDAGDYVAAPLNAANDVYHKIGGYFGGAITAACQAVPLCSDGLKYAGNVASEFFQWGYNQLIPNPFANLSGGRTFDMIAAGDDATQNTACVETLGCSTKTSVAMANIQNQQAAEDKAAFDSKPLFARMFSTDTPYSLISRMAVSMPTNLLGVTNTSLSGISASPISRLGSIFSSMFSTNHAFAAATPQDDPFGIVQYGYSDSEIAKIGDPQTYWDANCKQYYTEDTGKLDNSAWFNAQSQDTNTGQSLATTTNPCMLIQASVSSAGSLFDSSLIPADDSGGS